MHSSHPAACLMGALIGDAAALGLHWIYDVGRIAEIAAKRGGKSAFTPIDPENFENVPAFFAHGKRSDGMLTQYGRVLHLAVQCMNRNHGAFDVAAYQQDYVDTFGAGGSYQGYIDKPTRGTLANIAAKQLDPSGIRDNQLPALSTLPAIVLGYHGADNFSAIVEAAIQITNLDAEALVYGGIFAEILTRVLAGEDIGDALRASATTAGASGQTLLDALDTDEDNSVKYGEITERACHLSMGMPLAFHILSRAQSFEDAIERNILAGGDSAGRAIVIGAVMGARHGIAGPSGIPLEWILQTQDAAAIWRDCRLFTA